MSIVIDASVCVAAIVDGGADGDWAENIMLQAPLIAPELILVESTNVLRRLSLAGRLSDLEASTAQHDLMQMDMDLFPFVPFTERVWALRHNLTSYDAWYVALAEALELPLATLDQRLVNATGPACEFMFR